MKVPGTAVGAYTGPEMRARSAWITVLLLWLACAAWMVLSGWHKIVPMNFDDPDDAMRIVQVRDWMAGQSWFDVTQYRSQPPGGAPMHWSRLVDVPIALAIRLAALVVPMTQAERVALVVVPLLTLLALAAIVHALTVRATGRRLAGVTATAMLMLSLGVLIQFQPLRIDHHGWQIVLGAFAVLLTLRAVDARSARYALVAGFASALSLAVAIEGLPLVAGICAAFAFLYLRDPRGQRPLLAYLLALTGGSAAVMLATLGWPAMTLPWCDALSPAYLLPFLVATLTCAAAHRLLPRDRLGARLAALVLVGGGAALTFRYASPVCAAGPFAALDPLIARIWYRSVAEGMPIWTQPVEMRVLLPLPSLLGLAGAVWAIRADDRHRREGWIALLIVQAVAFLVSLMVMRAMGLAHLLALPASAWLFLRIFRGAQALTTSVGRIIASVACIIATPLGVEAVAVGVLPENASSVETRNADTARSECLTYAGLRGLDALPRAQLFAPLDISAHLLAYTHHSVAATGHHRARAGMKRVISGFIAPPAQAHRIIAGSGARYVALCGGENEVKKYAKLYPASLSAALLDDRAPAWLTRVPMRPGETIRVWRITG